MTRDSIDPADIVCAHCGGEAGGVHRLHDFVSCNSAGKVRYT